MEIIHENLELAYLGIDGDAYTYQMGAHYTVQIIDPRQSANGDWQADVRITGVTGRIFWGRCVLNSVSRRKEIISQFYRRTGDRQYNIDLALELMFEDCAQRLRQRFALSLYRHGIAAPVEYLLAPFLPRKMITVIAGDGGSGKGYFSLALALGVLSNKQICRDWHINYSGSVVYVDYESTQEDIFRRLDLLIHGANVDILDIHRFYYLHAETPFTVGFRDYASIIRERQPELVVVDSLAPAIGGGLEQSDLATELMRRLRQLDTTVLAIAHVAKASRGQEDATPYGSVFIQNLARNVWIQTRTSWTDTGLTISLNHTKSNVGRRHNTRHYRIDFSVDEVVISSTAPPESAQSDKSRIYNALTRPMQVKEIASLVGLSERRVGQLLDQLMADGVITRTGRGHKGDPYLYVRVYRGGNTQQRSMGQDDPSEQQQMEVNNE